MRTRRFTVKDITIMGMILSIFVTAKLIDIYMPKLPAGLDEATALLPFAIVSASLFAGFRRAFVPLLIYVFGISWIGGGTFFMSPLAFSADIASNSSMSNGEAYAGIYFLDYVIPLLILVLPSLYTKNKKGVVILTIVAMLINYFSHVASGYIVWKPFGPALGMGFIPYIFVGNIIRFGFLTTLTLLSLRIILSKRKLIAQDGYLNESSIIYIDGKKYLKREPKYELVDWDNEKIVYQKLGIDFKMDNGILIKEWFDGKCPKVWNKIKINSLKEEIEKFHKLNSEGVTTNDWMKYNNYLDTVSEVNANRFLDIVKGLNNKKFVMTHSDINKHNVLWNDNKIRLIDFEWTTKNHKYFDYAQFEITEGIQLLEANIIKSKEYQDIYFITLMYMYLWTFSTEENSYIKNLRKKYNKKIAIL